MNRSYAYLRYDRKIKFRMVSVQHFINEAPDDTRVATMAAEKAILCVIFEEYSEPDEIGINICLILQNTQYSHCHCRPE